MISEAGVIKSDVQQRSWVRVSGRPGEISLGLAGQGSDAPHLYVTLIAPA